MKFLEQFLDLSDAESMLAIITITPLRTGRICIQSWRLNNAGFRATLLLTIKKKKFIIYTWPSVSAALHLQSQPTEGQASLQYFLFIFKNFLCGPFFKSLLSLLLYCFCFMFQLFGPEACGIFAPELALKPHSLYQKLKSQPADHQGSPGIYH